jgi:hypothetical protein
MMEDLLRKNEKRLFYACGKDLNTFGRPLDAHTLAADDQRGGPPVDDRRIKHTLSSSPKRCA